MGATGYLIAYFQRNLAENDVFWTPSTEDCSYSVHAYGAYVSVAEHRGNHRETQGILRIICNNRNNRSNRQFRLEVLAPVRN
jgi:hypothetical protein